MTTKGEIFKGAGGGNKMHFKLNIVVAQKCIVNSECCSLMHWTK